MQPVIAALVCLGRGDESGAVRQGSNPNPNPNPCPSPNPCPNPNPNPNQVRALARCTRAEQASVATTHYSLLTTHYSLRTTHFLPPYYQVRVRTLRRLLHATYDVWWAMPLVLVRHDTGLEPRTSRQGPRQVCSSHV